MTIDMVPKFADEGEAQPEEVVETVQETTPEVPEEPSPEEPAEPAPQEAEAPQEDEREKELEGLRREKARLIQEVQALRGQKRDLKKEELVTVNEKIDELKDVHPDDAKLVEKVLRAKGMISQEEARKMFYDSVKKEQLDAFLDEFPEYKPENDPTDANWNALNREFALYRLPDDPRQIKAILKRAHQAIQDSSPKEERTIEVKRQQVKTASAGSSGVQKSPSTKSFDPYKRVMLQNGGFSDEDIKRMEERL